MFAPEDGQAGVITGQFLLSYSGSFTALGQTVPVLLQTIQISGGGAAGTFFWPVPDAEFLVEGIGVEKFYRGGAFAEFEGVKFYLTTTVAIGDETFYLDGMIPVLIPEPSTALLIGLGLVGLRLARKQT